MKLTRKEWYACACGWQPTWFKGDPEIDGMRMHHSCTEARKEVPEVDDLLFDDRTALYSQYCLEQAGIPAGDK